MIPLRTGHPARRGVVSFLWNSNPFYPISAALVLLGLRASCDPTSGAFPTWATLFGLAFYTSLLAGMAILLVRRLRAWDDVRTIVLLVVLVLFASPAFFDDVLARSPAMGIGCEVAGLVFAMAISEIILCGLALRLPWGFRVPYHLSLILFYLHPAALAPLLRSTDDPALPWAMFAFPLLAGAITLTLLPAARRGSAYVAKDGTPWRWPLYPWTLFLFIALNVCIRSGTHCLSLNYSGGTQGYEGNGGTIFGAYFLVPFGLAVAAVVLEIGLAARHRGVIRFALAAPIFLVGLATVGHRADPVHARFLREFIAMIGSTPMYAALLAAVSFYAISTWRGVRGAVDLMTVSVAALCLIGPTTLNADGLTSPQAAPLLLAGLIQMGAALTRRNVSRGLAALVCVATATAVGPVGDWGPNGRFALAAHVAIFGLMIFGAMGRDEFARALRGMAAAGLLLTWIAPLRTTLGTIHLLLIVPIGVAVLYGWLLGDRRFVAAAGIALACWGGRYGGSAYASLLRAVPGLDQILLGLLFFVVAALVSMAKAGAPLGRRHPRPPSLADDPAG